MKTLFQKMNKFGVLAVLFAALLITTQSAFKPSTSREVNGKRLTTYYFQYSGTNAETPYETAANWNYLGTTNPASDPCPGVNTIVCVLKADFASTPTSTDLANFLIAQAPGSPNGASLYCQNATHISYKQP